MTELAQAAEWHRQVAAIVAAADRAGVAVDQLPALRARLLAQQPRFAELAARRGTRLPALVPTPAEVAAAAPALGDLSLVAAVRAMRTAAATLDATDSLLGGGVPPVPLGRAGPAVALAVGSAEGPGVGPAAGSVAGIAPGLSAIRNALVYGGYALVVLVVQLVLLATLDEERTLPVLAPICLGVLPAFAWAAAWFTIGVAFGGPPGTPAARRSPRLGAAICLLPNLVLCAGVGVLFLTR